MAYTSGLTCDAQSAEAGQYHTVQVFCFSGQISACDHVQSVCELHGSGEKIKNTSTIRKIFLQHCAGQREQQYVTAQAGHRFKTVHNRDINESVKTAGERCLFFWQNTGDGHDGFPVKDNDTEKKHYCNICNDQWKKNVFQRDDLFQTGKIYIACEKGRAGIVGERHEIAAFPQGQLSLAVQI